MKELEYPFDSEWILKKKKSIKKQLLNSDRKYITKRIAVLGGSTTNDIIKCLEVFLLNFGIKAEFYESEYNKYWEDVMFENKELADFRPDLIFIHTTSRNILEYPDLRCSEQEIQEMVDQTFEKFSAMWTKIAEQYACPVIQNNFEQPFYRLMGNKDVSDIHGRLHFINCLNEKFYAYARNHEAFFINDINYIASCYGLQRWADPFYWYMYKYAMTVAAIPEFSYNIAVIVKSIFGKNKKAFVLDLDNTLWGGVIGDDGAENIDIGHENGKAETYTEFQQYLKAHKDLGVLLTINSKNEEENALAGLARPDSTLKKEDFIVIKANWEPKDRNIAEIAQELNLGTDSFVFVDDNPAERHIVKEQFPDTAVPEVGLPETYINIIDRSGFFEVTNFSEDDLKRNEMYIANSRREKQKTNFKDYTEYLISLDMHADIKPFSETYMARIAQLTNKSNQFNLTTLRCTQSDVERFAADDRCITLYGRLEDKFGDNGVVSVVSGHRENEEFHIDLWLMSCRVLKRDMEFAMMDVLVQKCRAKGIRKIWGYYYPTAKNAMVKEFYAKQGFTKQSEDSEGNTSWYLDIQADYENKNKVIKVEV